MHNKRQARTRRNLTSKWKLKGLTRQEARTRTVKAWATKHGRYHYGQYHGGHLVGSHEHFEALARLRDRQARKEVKEKFTPEELDAIRKAEETVHEHQGEEIDPDTLIDYQAREAEASGVRDVSWFILSQREFVDLGKFRTKADRDAVSQLPKNQQQAWRAGVRQYRGWKERHQHVDMPEVVNPATGEREKLKADQTDYEYIQHQDKERMVRKRLLELVKPDVDPDKESRTQSQLRQDIRQEIGGLRIKEFTPLREPAKYKEERDPTTGWKTGKKTPLNETARLEQKLDILHKQLETAEGRRGRKAVAEQLPLFERGLTVEKDPMEKLSDEQKAIARRALMRDPKPTGTRAVPPSERIPGPGPLEPERLSKNRQEVGPGKVTAFSAERRPVEAPISDSGRIKRQIKSLEDELYGERDITPERLEDLIITARTHPDGDIRASAAAEAHKVIGRLSGAEGRRWRRERDSAEMAKDEAATELRGVGPAVYRARTARMQDEPEDLNEAMHWAYRKARQHGAIGDFQNAQKYSQRLQELQNTERRTRIHVGRRDPLPREPRDLIMTEGTDPQADLYERALTRVNSKRIKQGKDPLEPQSRKADWLVQAEFHKMQQTNRIKSWTEGSHAFGLTEDRKVVGLVPKAGGKQGNMHKVAWGIAPNKEYEYTLRQDGLTPEGEAKPNVTKRIETFDKFTTFKVARRNQFGGRVQDEQDEVLSVREVPKLRDRLVYNQGTRVMKKDWDHRMVERQAKADNIDEVQYISLAGATGQTEDVPHPTETKTVYKVRDTTGRSRIVEKPEWDRADENYREATPGMPKQIRYVFQDPDKLKTAAGESDQVSLQLQKVPFVDKLAPQLEGRTGENVFKRRLLTNLAPDTTRDKIVGNYLRADAEIKFEKKAIQAAEIDHQLKTRRAALTGKDVHLFDDPTADEEAKKHGFTGMGELKQFSRAAAIAGLYGARRDVQKGYFPNAVNATVNKLRGRSQKLDTWLTEHHDLEDEIMTVNRAYVRPMNERMNNLGYQVQHPLSSPEGVSFGVDWGRVRYTNPWMHRDKREMRRFERYEASLDRVARGRERVIKHRNDTGIIGAIRNWRVEPMLRHPDYKDFNRSGGLLEKTRAVAEAYLDSDKVSFVDPITGQRVEHINKLTKMREPMEVTSGMRSHASSFLQRAEEIAEHAGGGAIPPRTVEGLGWNFNPKNPFVIGGAVLGTALAADYAYFKYKQHKLAPEERTSYLNHILPPSFKARMPHAEASAWYHVHSNPVTREFGIADDKIPVSWAFGTREREFKFRPVDRGYDSNLRLGLTGLRSGKSKGGSIVESLVFDQSNKNFRRNYKKGTHEVSIGGKKLPLEFTIGNKRKVEKSSKNPNKITNEQREDIVWAYQGRPDDEVQQVKDFYGFGKRDDILDMFNDPEVLKRAEKRHGKKEAQKHEHTFVQTIKRTERQWRESRP